MSIHYIIDKCVSSGLAILIFQTDTTSSYKLITYDDASIVHYDRRRIFAERTFYYRDWAFFWAYAKKIRRRSWISHLHKACNAPDDDGVWDGDSMNTLRCSNPYGETRRAFEIRPNFDYYSRADDKRWERTFSRFIRDRIKIAFATSEK